jgi:hypothetical protein
MLRPEPSKSFCIIVVPEKEYEDIQKGLELLNKQREKRREYYREQVRQGNGRKIRPRKVAEPLQLCTAYSNLTEWEADIFLKVCSQASSLYAISQSCCRLVDKRLEIEGRRIRGQVEESDSDDP